MSVCKGLRFYKMFLAFIFVFIFIDSTRGHQKPECLPHCSKRWDSNTMGHLSSLSCQAKILNIDLNVNSTLNKHLEESSFG